MYFNELVDDLLRWLGSILLLLKLSDFLFMKDVELEKMLFLRVVLLKEL